MTARVPGALLVPFVEQEPEVEASPEAFYCGGDHHFGGVRLEEGLTMAKAAWNIGERCSTWV